MSPSYGERELYGGAISVDLPSDYLDASDLRQIPDHQEVYLSSTTLTSVIFEINNFTTDISPSQLATLTNSGSDNAAASYHFEDALDTGDTFLNNQITTQSVTMSSATLQNFPCFLSSGTILSSEVDRNAKPAGALPQQWQATQPTTTSEVRAWQVLVRMQQYSTDLCVRVNVPLKEFRNVQAGEGETALGQEIVKKIMQSLEIRDFGLFAAD